MRQWLKRNIGILYIGLLTLVLAVILLRSDELPNMIRTLSQLDVRFVWAAASCIVIYLLLRATTLHYYLKSRGCAPRFFQSMLVSGIGQFYSAVTPSASGGQPLQVLAMHQMGIPISISTAAVSVKFIFFQLAFMLLGGVLWLTHLRMVAQQLGHVRWLVAVGYVINALLIAAVGMTMAKSPLIDRLMDLMIRLGAKLKLVRDPDKTREHARHTLKEYRSSLMTLKNRPMDAAVMFLLSLLQVAFYMSVVCCLYHAFRLSGTSDTSLLTLQLLLFITAAFVPLPGAAGAQEGGFYLFFRGLIPETDIVAMMVCWRFFTYYLLLILGMVGVVLEGVLRKTTKNWQVAP